MAKDLSSNKARRNHRTGETLAQVLADAAEVNRKVEAAAAGFRMATHPPKTHPTALKLKMLLEDTRRHCRIITQENARTSPK